MDLERLAPILESIVKKSLTDKVYIYGRYQKSYTNRVATGKLVNSINAKITPNKQGITVIQMQAFGKPLNNTYAYWLANDRGPGNVAKGVIEEWIMNKKSFKIKDFKTGRFLPKNEKNVKSVAYLIRRSMKIRGYQNIPKNFVEISLEEINNNPQILEIVGEEGVEVFKKLIEGL